MSEQWYWCRRHDRVEPEGGCRALDRLGPYESPEAAQRWRERVEAREETWKDQDEEWHGSKDAWDRQDDEWESR